MTETVAIAEPWSTSIGKAGWRALAASWLGWMFDGYESYALILVMGVAVRQLVPPEKLPKASSGALAHQRASLRRGGVQESCGTLREYRKRFPDEILAINNSRIVSYAKRS